MKRFVYKRIDTVLYIKELAEAGRTGVDIENILAFFCANPNSEWEFVTSVFDKNGHEIIYLKKEV